MCMFKAYIFLSCLILGPSNPRVDINVYLELLIDKLKKFWSGVLAYDVSRKQNLMMKTTLMWIINNFLAYGILSGWGTHGRFVCSHCMKHKKSFTLHYVRKICWFDSCHGLLPNNHPLRDNKKTFIKGKIERDGWPPN